MVRKQVLLLPFAILYSGIIPQVQTACVGCLLLTGCRGCSSCSLIQCKKCANGFYLELGRCRPCDTNCISCKGRTTCSLCHQGFYGRICEQTCGEGCTDNGCDKLTGSCMCKDNFSGDKCDHCVAGKYGNQCQYTCQNCVCNERTGNCISCGKGYFPSGKVCKICENGTWGINCKDKCPDGCAVCKPEDGTCIVCFDGKYSTNCSLDCSPNCMARNDAPICAKGTGACILGCSSSSRHGEYCSKNCSANCKESSCDWKSGKCINGCIPNHAGDNCSEVLNSVLSSDNSSDSSSLPFNIVLVGAGCGGAMTMLVIILLVVTSLRRRKKHEKHLENTSTVNSPTSPNVYEQLQNKDRCEEREYGMVSKCEELEYDMVSKSEEPEYDMASAAIYDTCR